MKETTAAKTVKVTKNPIMRKAFNSRLVKMRGQIAKIAEIIHTAGSVTIGELVNIVDLPKSHQSTERVVRYYVSVLKSKKFVTVS